MGQGASDQYSLWYSGGSPSRTVGSVIEEWLPSEATVTCSANLLVLISLVKRVASLMVSQNHVLLFPIELAIVQASKLLPN